MISDFHPHGFANGSRMCNSRFSMFNRIMQESRQFKRGYWRVQAAAFFLEDLSEDFFKSLFLELSTAEEAFEL